MSRLVGEQVISITLAYVPLDLILPDQPNRAVLTRMLRGVGGALMWRQADESAGNTHIFFCFNSIAFKQVVSMVWYFVLRSPASPETCDGG